MSDNEEESKVLETHTFEFEGKPFTLTITEPPKNVAELATVTDEHDCEENSIHYPPDDEYDLDAYYCSICNKLLQVG